MSSTSTCAVDIGGLDRSLLESSGAIARFQRLRSSGFDLADGDIVAEYIKGLALSGVPWPAVGFLLCIVVLILMILDLTLHKFIGLEMRYNRIGAVLRSLLSTLWMVMTFGCLACMGVVAYALTSGRDEFQQGLEILPEPAQSLYTDALVTIETTLRSVESARERVRNVAGMVLEAVEAGELLIDVIVPAAFAWILFTVAALFFFTAALKPEKRTGKASVIRQVCLTLLFMVALFVLWSSTGLSAAFGILAGDSCTVLNEVVADVYADAEGVPLEPNLPPFLDDLSLQCPDLSAALSLEVVDQVLENPSLQIAWEEVETVSGIELRELSACVTGLFESVLVSCNLTANQLGTSQTSLCGPRASAISSLYMLFVSLQVLAVFVFVLYILRTTLRVRIFDWLEVYDRLLDEHPPVLLLSDYPPPDDDDSELLTKPGDRGVANGVEDGRPQSSRWMNGHDTGEDGGVELVATAAGEPSWGPAPAYAATASDELLDSRFRDRPGSDHPPPPPPGNPLSYEQSGQEDVPSNAAPYSASGFYPSDYRRGVDEEPWNAGNRRDDDGYAQQQGEDYYQFYPAQHDQEGHAVESQPAPPPYGYNQNHPYTFRQGV